MIPTQHTRAPAPSPTRIKIIQGAEMIDTTGVKAVYAFQGQLFTSLIPETTAEAESINVAVQALRQAVN
jgi:hypothetical protein